MATGELDQFILAPVDSSWRQVAMAVALALVDSGLDFPETDDDAAFVAGRMELLIALGRLEA